MMCQFIGGRVDGLEMDIHDGEWIAGERIHVEFREVRMLHIYESHSIYLAGLDHMRFSFLESKEVTSVSPEAKSRRENPHRR